MEQRFPERPTGNLAAVAEEMLGVWDAEETFRLSIESRPADRPFVFYEGPPSANGVPGIHHVMARTLKDLFCRYKTLQGFRVERKAGWDTHGLPIELGVEKELGITKEDIGHRITVEAYNAACREAVMRYTGVWNDLTRKMGYWVDMEHPYVTYENTYIESVWWLISRLHAGNMLYKGYTIQPYSPAAGTGLSSHELNQPGCYREVKDTSVVAQFRALPECADRIRLHAGPQVAEALAHLPVDFLAWTTTPWTLPSNTALTVGPAIVYALVRTANRYTGEEVLVVCAEARLGAYFGAKGSPDHEVIATLAGAELCGARYEQLLEWAQPMDRVAEAFRVIPGDFVTTEDGTGIVHTAPTFGADDARAAAAAGVPPLLVDDGAGHGVPLVDLQGRFRVGPLTGRYVKADYEPEQRDGDERNVDVEIAIGLKERGRAFLVEKYAHSYPHCWRTDKPVLYYPLDAWFIRASAARERMQELNATIQWKPESTGTGRFGKWLENLNDWNLSRSRYWGIPIPIWRTEDGTHERCISSVEELQSACAEAVASGLMDENPFATFVPGDFSTANYTTFDLHKHVVDRIVLRAPDGRPMRREPDLIDVWFDSGAMPYAQWHYPFENQDKIDKGLAFPADFIAEGVDQTRGWFYTLHAIATLVFDRVAYRNVISNGLVLDKNGQKMSKRLGNAVDPFATLATYGPDATRWYMMANAAPWDNLRFDPAGIEEVTRRFFGTLHNTYSFLALYANIDGFDGSGPEIPLAQRPELDRWILSRLNSLSAEVEQALDSYEPTRAARAIQEFVVDDLSNWHVRLSRRRFWKEADGTEKRSAYATLHTCLRTVAVLASPIAPFTMDRLFRDLEAGVGRATGSVHLATFPTSDASFIDAELEARMGMAQRCVSLALSLRKREKLRVRQPLRRLLVPVADAATEARWLAVRDVVLSELNIKSLEFLREGDATAEVSLVRRAKADFKVLGPRMGTRMKAVAAAVAQLSPEAVSKLERTGSVTFDVDGTEESIAVHEVQLTTDDIPGWCVASEYGLTVALDLALDAELKAEGLTRELVNRVQNLRKDRGLEVTDRIALTVEADGPVRAALEQNLDYLRAETLAEEVAWMAVESAENVELVEGTSVKIDLRPL